MKKEPILKESLLESSQIKTDWEGVYKKIKINPRIWGKTKKIRGLFNLIRISSSFTKSKRLKKIRKLDEKRYWVNMMPIGEQ